MRMMKTSRLLSTGGVLMLIVIQAWALDVRLVETIQVDPKGAEGTSEVVEFSPDGNLLAAGNKQGEVVIISMADFKTVRKLIYTTDTTSQAKAGEVECCAFSRDGQLLAAGGNVGNLRVFRVSDGTEVGAFPQGQTDGMVFNHKGDILVCGDGGWVKIYDTADWAVHRAFKYGGYGVNSVAFTSDDQYLLAGGADAGGVVRVFRIAGGEFSVRQTQAPEQYHSIKSVRLSPDDQYIATANAAGNSMKLFRFADGALVAELPQGGYMEAVEFTIDGRYVMVAGKGGIVRFYSMPDLALVKEIAAHEDTVEYIDASPDGRHIATASEDGNVKVWLYEPDAPE